MKVCPLCHATCLSQHSELYFWAKCNICGYAEISFDTMSLEQTKHAKANPLALMPDQAAVAVIEKSQKDRYK